MCQAMNYIWMLFVITLQSHSLQAVKNVKRNTYNTLDIKWIEVYEHDNNLLKDFVLKKTAVRGKVGRITVSFELMKSLNYLESKCSILQRLSSNAYQPTVINNLKFNLCDIMKNNETLYFGTQILQQLYPPLGEKFIKYKEYVHPCPFPPVNFFVDEVVDEFVLPDFFAIVDAKLLCRTYDRNNNTVVDMGVYVAVKRGKPVGRN